MAQRKNRTFRIQNVPPSFGEIDLTNALQSLLEENERASDLHLSSLSLTPSCVSSDSSRTALIQFAPDTPAFLKAVASDKTGVAEHQVRVQGALLSFDSHFFGLTQVFNVQRDVNVTMESVKFLS